MGNSSSSQQIDNDSWETVEMPPAEQEHTTVLPLTSELLEHKVLPELDLRHPTLTNTDQQSPAPTSTQH